MTKLTSSGKPVLLLAIFCTLLLLSVKAQPPGKINLDMKNAPLITVLAAIEKQTGIPFIFNRQEVEKVQVAHASYQQKSLTEVLDHLLGQYRFRYKLESGSILVSPQGKKEEKKSLHNPGKIAGTIIDEETGMPQPDVSIRVGDKGVTSGMDGAFSITLPAGKYEAEISAIGYGKKMISEIEVTEGGVAELNVPLKREKNTLERVVIKSSARRESIAYLYARQKNEAGISNGISREQIAALPDKNIGETLKRISGVSTNDNRRVVVRGIAERYNLAMMDGAILPSTDVQVRDFEFDIIPSNLIDNVIVSKTSTPDMSFGFGGGLVQVNTFAIPNQNFITIGGGIKYISGSTGKDFLGYGRGKNDYLGFDDGTRGQYPKDLFVLTRNNYDPSKPYNPPVSNVPPVTPAMIGEQNKKIGGFERLGTRVYTAKPGQNYQFSLGRNYNIKNNRFGFVGSLSYRNEQVIDDVSRFERGNWQKSENLTYDTETGKEIRPTTANVYNFNTTWGALFNMGWSGKHHKITFRNFYSRLFSNQFTRTVGFGNDIGFGDLPAIREYDRPKYINLLQNRLEGEHSFGAFRFDWTLSRNKLTNYERDAVEFWLSPTYAMNGSYVYQGSAAGINNAGNSPFTRSHYRYEETNRIAETALSYGFNLAGKKQTAKLGYQYLERNGLYDWTILPVVSAGGGNNAFAHLPVQEWSGSLEFKEPLSDFLYFPATYSINGYAGRNINQAYYAMFDNRFANWVRLVWGVRAEYFKYEKLRNGVNDKNIDELILQGEKDKFVDPETGELVTPTANPETEEKTWRYLPSASLTLSPLRDFNIRAAYSQAVVRPALIENSRITRFDPSIGAFRRSDGVLSTLIDHYDFRLEWYPQPGEVISAGYFYKYFDKPVELYRTITDATARVYAITSNSNWAKVHGWEFDVRKNLGFLKPGWKFLDNLFFSGNLTLQQSEVQASVYEGKSIAEDKYGNRYQYRTQVLLKEKRPLYGQVPVVYNAGLQYTGERLGLNVTFNHMGYKTFLTGLRPELVEYERPRNQLDAQLSYNFLKSKKLAVKLNMTNLLNNAFRFYTNDFGTYQFQDKWKGMTEAQIYSQTENWSEIYEWKHGFSQKYEEGHYETSGDGKTKTRVGDRDTFIRKVGASFSLSVAYTL
jgi:hypothetical protein